MKVGVVGSGDVAKTLGSGFLKHGHEVMLGTRAPAKLADWAQQNPKGRVGGFAEAAKKTVSEVLVQFGWDTADMGKAEAARAIEPLCMLWCICGGHGLRCPALAAGPRPCPTRYRYIRLAGRGRRQREARYFSQSASLSRTF